MRRDPARDAGFLRQPANHVRCGRPGEAAAAESTQQRLGCGYGAGECGEVVRLDAPRHEVTAQVVLDPPGHVRLPSEDDEVIDRAVVVQSLTGMPVALLTYDTGQAMLGRQAGLHVRKQNKPKDEEAGGQPAASTCGRCGRPSQATTDIAAKHDPQQAHEMASAGTIWSA